MNEERWPGPTLTLCSKFEGKSKEAEMFYNVKFLGPDFSAG